MKKTGQQVSDQLSDGIYLSLRNLIVQDAPLFKDSGAHMPIFFQQ